MTPAERRALWKDVNDSLTVAFKATTKLRPERPGFVTDPLTGRQELAWVPFERKAMWVATNVWRQTNGFPATTEEDIARVEQMAHGHTDYASKFILYCTELALGDQDIRP
jgi:hypothetical protein